MKLYIAATYTSNFDLESQAFIRLTDTGKAARRYPKFQLESYHYVNKDSFVRKMRRDGCRVFLDSGAFSAFTKGYEIDLKAYARYIHDNQDIIEVASVLDAIGDPRGTWENQKRLESLDCAVLPCYHYGEPEGVLEYYIKNYEYITIGGMVPVATPQLRIWLDRIWTQYLTDDTGKARLKVHGFGLTVPELMRRYPWYSVDSSSWVQIAANGGIFLPEMGALHVSEHSPARKIFGQHYATLSPHHQEFVRERCHHYGFDIHDLATDYIHRWAMNMYTFALLGDQISAENKDMIFKLKQPVLL